jgi:hypothetical protein
MIPPIVALVLFGVSAAVMLLWNWLLPGLFHVPEIGYWQAMGLLVLSRILLGGFHHKAHHHHPRHWKHHMENMSDEEREKIRQEWQSCCSPWFKRTPPPTP